MNVKDAEGLGIVNQDMGPTIWYRSGTPPNGSRERTAVFFSVRADVASSGTGSVARTVWEADVHLLSALRLFG